MMIESIESIDRYLVLLINGYHFQFLDVIMWFFSGPFIIIPIAAMVLWSIYTSYDLKQSIYILLGIMIAIGLADLSSVHLFKEVFMRYRPSHHLELLKQLHFHDALHILICVHETNRGCCSSQVIEGMRGSL